MEKIDFLTTEDSTALDFCIQYISSAWHETLEEATARLLKYARGDDGSFCLVAKISGTPVGMMACYRRTGLQTDGIYEPWTAGLYVAESYRKQGIGERILAAVQTEAHARGHQKLHLATDKEQLKRWYTRLGWRIIGKAWDEEHQYQVFMSNLGR